MIRLRVGLKLGTGNREKRHVIGETVEIGASSAAAETERGTPGVHDLRHDRKCRPMAGPI